MCMEIYTEFDAELMDEYWNFRRQIELLKILSQWNLIFPYTYIKY